MAFLSHLVRRLSFLLMRTPIRMASSVSVRVATLADFDDVMAINTNIYEGMDILPTYYHDYCSDPKRHLFLAETNGTVVGFLLRHVTAGGRLNSFQAVRVHPDYTGQGVMQALLRHSHIHIRNRYPQLERTAYTVHYMEVVKSIVSRMPFQELISKRPRYSFGIECGLLSHILKLPAVQPLTTSALYLQTEPLPAAEALRVLTQVVDPDEFTAERLWVVNFQPVDHNDEDLRACLDETTVYVTWDETCHKIRTISFLTIMKARLGWRCRADFYCVSEETRPDTLTAHVLRHVEYLDGLQLAEYASYSVLYPAHFPGPQSADAVQAGLPLQRKRGASETTVYLLVCHSQNMDEHLASAHV